MNRLQRFGLLMRELETNEEDIFALRDYCDTLEYGDEEEKADARIPEVLSAKDLYYQLVPDGTERLRQRDFVLLNKVGYEIRYDRLTDKYIARFPHHLAETYGLVCADGKSGASRTGMIHGAENEKQENGYEQRQEQGRAP